LKSWDIVRSSSNPKYVKIYHTVRHKKALLRKLEGLCWIAGSAENPIMVSHSPPELPA
jgi:hypothetical protein